MVSCCFLHRVGCNERLMKDFIYVVRYVGFFCACMSFLCKLFYVIAFYVLWICCVIDYRKREQIYQVTWDTVVVKRLVTLGLDLVSACNTNSQDLLWRVFSRYSSFLLTSLSPKIRKSPLGGNTFLPKQSKKSTEMPTYVRCFVISIAIFQESSTIACVEVEKWNNWMKTSSVQNVSRSRSTNEALQTVPDHEWF